jgi:radical SAM protein
MTFDSRPFLVIWEVTRACALACVHCRADAIARRDPRELSTAEAFNLVDQVRAFGEPRPVLVLTGGDPLWRIDLALIVRYAAKAGLTVALTPSGTAAATNTRLRELKESGLSRLAVSLDGPDAVTHDTFRRVRGSYHWTMRIVENAIAMGLPLQINTTISRQTLSGLRALAAKLTELPLALWAVFFLVQTGRGTRVDPIAAEECEDVLRFLYTLSLTSSYGIKTTEAPHYRRVVWEHQEEGGYAGGGNFSSCDRLRSPRAVTDGNGVVFVDHTGNICPSGFLPSVRGNVRDGTLVATYRDDQVFNTLRNPNLLQGTCGRCRYRTICGGSRARAFAETGNMFGSDPLCAYQPSAGVEEPVLEYAP